MAKPAQPQGRKPHKAPAKAPDSSTRQSGTGTTGDNRKPPKASTPPDSGPKKDGDYAPNWNPS